MSEPPNSASVLATLYWDRPEVESNPQYGAWVAAYAFFVALLEHGTWDGYDFFTLPSRREAATRLLRDLRPRDTRIRRFADLTGSGDGRDISAWHVISVEHAMIPFAARRRYAGGVFPITLVHHTISYQELLHGSFLRLLLDDPLPCDSIICPSNASRQAMERLLDVVAERFNSRYGTDICYQGRLDTIPLGVDTAALKPGDQATARKQLMLPTEPLMLLWLGRISATDKADLSPLLVAFADVVRYVDALSAGEDRPLMLVIAGADPNGEAPLLERQARALGIGEMVQIRTFVDAFRRPAYYAAADIFVAPVDNIQETFGLTPIEAMACGLPQVAADWDGYRDTVAHGETGLLVPTRWTRCDDDLLEDPLVWPDRTDHASLAQSVAVDPTQLRSSLLTLISSEELRLRMGSASRRRAETLFSWQHVICRHEELWHELQEVANRLEPVPPSGDDYWRPEFFEVFRHYATTILDDDDVIRRSPSGTTALANVHDLAPRFGDMDPDLLRLALEQIDEEGARLGEAVNRLRTQLDGEYTDALLRRQVMRLIKYGYAQIASP